MTIRVVERTEAPDTALVRYTPRRYAAENNVTKETVYAWIDKGQLPAGAKAYRTQSNRFVITVDPGLHPTMPLFPKLR